MKQSIILCLLMLASTAANADCWYNGYYYPPGTTVVGFICQVDGTWG